MAEYAVNNKVASEPAFAWWVPHTLKHHDRIIKKVKAWYWKRTHKFGIELPKTLERVINPAPSEKVSDGYQDQDVFNNNGEARKLVASLSSNKRKSVLMKEKLARRWGVGLDTAKSRS